MTPKTYPEQLEDDREDPQEFSDTLKGREALDRWASRQQD